MGRKILDDDMARASGLVYLGFIFLTLPPVVMAIACWRWSSDFVPTMKSHGRN